MLNSFGDNLLLEIIVQLHPLDLLILRCVCRRIRDIINCQSTAIWLFKRRYGIQRIPPNNLSFFDLVFPYPGGEKYIECTEGYRRALQALDKESVEYFRDRSNIHPSISLAFTLLTSLKNITSVTKEQVDNIRQFLTQEIIKREGIHRQIPRYIRQYGRVLGCYQDGKEIFEEEYPIYGEELLVGYIVGLIQSGKDEGYDRIKVLTDDILINDEFDGLVYNPRFDELAGRISNGEINQHDLYYLYRHFPVDKIMKHPNSYKSITFRGEEMFIYLDYLVGRKRGLDKYLIDHYPHLLPSLQYYTPRIVIWYKENNIDRWVDHDVIIRLYQEIIYYGDWDILDKFLHIPYSFPRSKYLNKPLYQLVKEGNIRRIGEIIARFRQLRITNPSRFYTTLFHSACREGRKDLVEFCLPYLPAGIKISLPRRRITLAGIMKSFGIESEKGTSGYIGYTKSQKQEMRDYLLSLKKEYGI